MTDTTKTFLEEVKFAYSIIDDITEWDDCPAFDDEFRKLIMDVPDNLENKDYVECGSYRPYDDPAAALYRMLWLVKPKQVNFSDMYKTRLFWFMSKDKQVIVTVELYKYEPALYFYALRPLVDTSGVCGIWAGRPGADNGITLIDETAKAFVSLVKHAAGTQHMIYGGNDFEV
jgi:hypothetical protein